MRKKLYSVALALILLTSLSLSAADDTKKSEPKKKDPPPALKVGDTAPDFTLLSYDGKELHKVQLSDFKGKKNVALAFFVFAFTGG